MKIVAFPIERYRLDYDAALAELELARFQHLCAIDYHELGSPWRVSTYDRYQMARVLLDHVRKYGIIEYPEVGNRGKN